MSEIRGRLALVTGGASGIGRSIALALADEGASLALVDIDEAGLQDAMRQVENRGASATIHVLDVTDFEAVKSLAERVEPQILVNCAGIAQIADFEKTTIEDFQRIIDVDLWSAIYTTKVFLTSLEADGGHIVNVSSADGLIALPGSSAYCTAKFALVGLSEVQVMELRGRGIGVTSVCPGFTWTPMVESISLKGVDRGRLDRFLDLVRPLVFTTPEKLASAVLKSVKRDRYLLVHTPLCKVLYAVKRISPALYVRVVATIYSGILKRVGVA